MNKIDHGVLWVYQCYEPQTCDQMNKIDHGVLNGVGSAAHMRGCGVLKECKLEEQRFKREIRDRFAMPR
jgi:hypothetical protein